MPAALTNDRNPLIKILHLGLLDRQTHPVTGANGCLGYGLSGKDTINLQRTCKAADAHLFMSQRDQIGLVAHACTIVKHGRQPQPVAMARARTYLTRQVEASDVKPKGLYTALAEMGHMGRSLVVAKSTLAERQVAITTLTLMFAESGVMTSEAAVTDWIERMRSLPTSLYRDYLKTSGNQALRDAGTLGLRLGLAAGSVACVYQAAHLASTGPAYIKPLAALTAPTWPLLCVGAVLSAAKATPALIGFGFVGADGVKELTAYAQMRFYKDAVLFDMVSQPRAPLLQDHHPDWHLYIVDTRLPRRAEDVGFFYIKAFGEALECCIEDALCF